MSNHSQRVDVISREVIKLSESHLIMLAYLDQFPGFSDTLFKDMSAHIDLRSVQQRSINEPLTMKEKISCQEILEYSLKIETNPLSSIEICSLINQIRNDNKSRYFVNVSGYQFYLQIMKRSIFIYDIFEKSKSNTLSHRNSSLSTDLILEVLLEFKSYASDKYCNICVSPIVVRTLGADVIDIFPAISSGGFIEEYDR